MKNKLGRMMERSTADILLLGSGRNGERYAFSQKVSASYPHTGIIMMEDELLGRNDAQCACLLEQKMY